MSHQARAAFRPPSPSSLPKRRATLSARRELWLCGGDSSDEDPRSAVPAPRGGSVADADLFESPSADTFSIHSSLGKSCIIIEDNRASSEICEFQHNGSDKTCFNTKCTIRAHCTPEASSPVVKPGLYFRSGPSGIAATRFFNSQVSDLSILDLYSDPLSRIE